MKSEVKTTTTFNRKILKTAGMLVISIPAEAISDVGLKPHMKVKIILEVIRE